MGDGGTNENEITSFIILEGMWLVLVRRGKFFNSELGNRNTEFFNRVRSHEKKFKLHEKTMHVKQEDINKWTASHSKKEMADKIATEAK